MKRVEFLLIALMMVCILTFLSACGKKNNKAARTVNETPYSDTYSYNNPNSCSVEMLLHYEMLDYTCEGAWTWNEVEDCRHLIEDFMSQYPQINCEGETHYKANSKRPKNISITTEKLQKKLKKLK